MLNFKGGRMGPPISGVGNGLGLRNFAKMTWPLVLAGHRSPQKSHPYCVREGFYLFMPWFPW